MMPLVVMDRRNNEPLVVFSVPFFSPLSARRNAKILAAAGPGDAAPVPRPAASAMDVDPPAAPAGGGAGGALGGGSKPRRAADPALVSQVRNGMRQSMRKIRTSPKLSHRT